MFDPQVQAYRAALRDRYQEIMLTDMQAATRLSIENNMWKLIYYKMIEEFRVLLKAVQAILIQSKLKPLGKGDNFEERKEGRTLLASYRAFLTDAFGFYNEFIQRMLSCYKITDSCHQVSKILDVIEPIDIIQSPNSCKADPDNEVFGVMNRSLIHLGDLARYREFHAEKKQKHWRYAKCLYAAAMCLVPEDGNSSNQLAVIETYEGNEFAAAEMYFRSLQVAQPFPSALGNLLLLFKKAERQINKTQMAFDFKTSFLGLLGCLLGEKSINKFTAQAPIVLERFQGMIEAHEAEPSEIIRGLIILLGAVYLMSRNKAVYGAHMPQVVDFMYQMMTLLLSRVSLLLKEQTAENLAAPSGIEESSLEYAEGFLKSITVILYAMQSDMMRDLYLVTSCRKIAECVGATCTLIIEFRKCLYYHPTHLSKPIIESKLPWLEFSPTLSLQKSNSTSTAPGRNVTIQLDSIKEIAIKICKIKPAILFEICDSNAQVVSFTHIDNSDQAAMNFLLSTVQYSGKLDAAGSVYGSSRNLGTIWNPQISDSHAPNDAYAKPDYLPEEDIENSEALPSDSLDKVCPVDTLAFLGLELPDFEPSENNKLESNDDIHVDNLNLENQQYQTSNALERDFWGNNAFSSSRQDLLSENPKRASFSADKAASFARNRLSWLSVLDLGYDIPAPEKD